MSQDEKGDIVRDVNGKPLIHTDGVGYISKNLAMRCQEIVIKGVKRPEKDKQVLLHLSELFGFKIHE